MPRAQAAGKSQPAASQVEPEVDAALREQLQEMGFSASRCGAAAGAVRSWWPHMRPGPHMRLLVAASHAVASQLSASWWPGMRQRTAAPWVAAGRSA